MTAPDELPPIEIIPFGRTEEQQAKLDRTKARATRAIKIFCLELIAVFLAILAASLYASFTLGP